MTSAESLLFCTNGCQGAGKAKTCEVGAPPAETTTGRPVESGSICARYDVGRLQLLRAAHTYSGLLLALQTKSPLVLSGLLAHKHLVECESD